MGLGGRSTTYAIAAIAAIAVLNGEPGRAARPAALMDGRGMTVADLVATAGVIPQTTSGHLGRLSEAGLAAME